MKILFLTDNFPPESNAPASRTYEHATEWVRAGHQVTVLTTAPNFPEGVVYKGYRNAWRSEEDMDGIRVVRVGTYIAANQGFARRTLDYLSFSLAGVWHGLREQRPDVIVGTSPQFFTAWGSYWLALFKRRPFVFELRDLWPESIRAVGALSDGPALSMLTWMEEFLYDRARAIVSVTDSFRDALEARGVDRDKLHLVLNGVDLSRYQPQPRDAELAHAWGLEGRFVVGYIGTHGMAHGLDTVLEAADLLRDEPSIVFLLVGSGAERARLVERARAMDLDNVRLVDRQPKELMPRVWSLCDVSLIHLRDDPLFAQVIPSKIFESMGMGLPILIALPEGEATALVEEAGAGRVAPPGDPAALAAAVRELYADPEQRSRLAQASRQAAERYSRAAQAQKMLDVLREVATA